MDPLTISTGVITIFDMASKLSVRLFKYVKSVQNAKSEAEVLIDEITKFQLCLAKAQRMLRDESGDKNSLKRLEMLNEVLDDDSPVLQDLKKSFKKIRSKITFDEDKYDSLWDHLKATSKRLKWPLQEDDVLALKNNMTRVMTKIDFAYGLDTTALLLKVDTMTEKTYEVIIAHGESSRMKDEEEKLRRQREETEKNRETIAQWLKLGNHHTSLERAREARSKSTSTGLWFLEGYSFDDWKSKQTNNLLWLQGLPGFGKTVLSATIIDSLLKTAKEDEKMIVAYWYFSANEKSKINASGCIRSLLVQIMRHYQTRIPDAINDLWEASSKDVDLVPEFAELLSTLQRAIAEEKGMSFYIVLDALDEVNEGDIEHVFELLDVLLGSEMMRMHVLVTSRPSIRTQYGDRIPSCATLFDVSLEALIIQSDIKSVIDQKLNTFPLLQQAGQEQRKVEITNQLLEKSQGSFRLVDCQLQALGRCKRVNDISRVLERLPKDLKELYERDLENITDEDDARDVLNLVKWLTFPRRDLTTNEIGEIMAINYDPSNEEALEFDPGDRVNVPEELVYKCGSLLKVESNARGKNHLGAITTVQSLSTSHNTVLDFFKTQTIKVGPLEAVRITSAQTNRQMALTSLIYLRFLFREIKPEELTAAKLLEYPAARLCAELWDDYYREAIGDPREKVDMALVDKLAIDFFQSKDDMLKWIRICNPDNDEAAANLQLGMEDVNTPLYYASLLGLKGLVQHYINNGEDANEESSFGAGSALAAATWNYHLDIVKMLLKAGASIKNGNQPYWGKAIAIAVQRNTPLEKSSLEILKEFVSREEFDPNDVRFDRPVVANEEEPRPVRHDEPLLCIAARNKSPEAFDLLLERNADVNKTGGEYHTVIKAAATQGNNKMVEKLLDRGAKVDVYGGYAATALVCGCIGNIRVDLIRRMVENGCSVASQKVDNVTWSALHAAVEHSTPEVVSFLIESGCDVNEQGIGMNDNCLQMACVRGDKAIVKILLDSHADFTVQDRGEHGTALRAAVFRGHLEVVRMLLESGAPVNVDSSHFSSALWSAAIKHPSNDDYDDMIELLLEYGADPYYAVENSDMGMALQKLQSKRSIDMFHERGFDLNRDNKYINLIGHRLEDPTLDLMDHMLKTGGVDVNHLHPKWGRTLTIAINKKKDQAVKRLLQEKSLEIDAMDDYAGGTALHLAATKDQVEIAEMLLLAKADPNAYHRFSGPPIVTTKSPEITDLLIKHGADIKVMTMTGKTQLLVNVMWNNVGIVDKLFSLGYSKEVRDLLGGNILHYAAMQCDADTVKKFLDMGLDMNEQDVDGWTPLHYACSSAKGTAKIVRLLIDCGADINVTDKNDQTPQQIAKAFLKAAETAILRHPNLRIEESLRLSTDGIHSQTLTWEDDAMCWSCNNRRGSHHTCRTCEPYVFALCFKCYDHREHIHPEDHKFEEIEDKNAWDDVSLRDMKISFEQGDNSRPQALIWQESVGQHFRREGKSYIIGTTSDNTNAIQLRGDKPLSDDHPYFEIKCLSSTHTENPMCLGIGLGPSWNGHKGMPGWTTGTIGYHCDDGDIFIGRPELGSCLNLGNIWKEHDVVGCGIDMSLAEDVRTVFFTKNGKNLGRFIVQSDTGPLYPIVGCGDNNNEFVVNFGEDDFVWKGERWDGIIPLERSDT